MALSPWVVNTRISLGGMWAFFLSVGVVRGLTVLEKHFTRYYETNTAGISLMSSLLLLGYLVGGMSAGVVIPKFGVKIPTILSGVSCIIGSCIIASTLYTKNLTIPYVIVMIMLGSPQGLCINTTMASSRFNVQHKFIGLVMTLMGGGVSVAALILPKIYKTMFNVFFDGQPVMEGFDGRNQTNDGLTFGTYPEENFQANITKKICLEHRHSYNLTVNDCYEMGEFYRSALGDTASSYPNAFTRQHELVDIMQIQKDTPEFLILDMKRSILFAENELHQNFTNLYYPLMMMWYFIGATMIMLIVAGVLILEKPSKEELKALKKAESRQKIDQIRESDTTESELENGNADDQNENSERNSKKSDSKKASKSSKKRLNPSNEDIINSNVSDEESENYDEADTKKLIKENIKSSKPTTTSTRAKSKSIMESIQMTLPKDYGDATIEQYSIEKTGTQEEVVGLFSWKLATQYSFICHSISQLLFFSGYFCILPYLDGLLSYFDMPEVERPDFILIMGVVELFSRLWHAFYLVDRSNKLKLIAFTYFGDGVGLMICLLGYYFRDYWKVFMILSFVIGGYFNAGFGGLVMACLVEITDENYFSIGVAMQSVSIGIGESLGPIIGGAVNSGQFEGELGYLVAVLVGCILMMVGGLVAGLMFYAFRYEQEQKKKQSRGGKC